MSRRLKGNGDSAGDPTSPFFFFPAGNREPQSSHPPGTPDVPGPPGERGIRRRLRRKHLWHPHLQLTPTRTYYRIDPPPRTSAGEPEPVPDP
ncbi:hypothetical protein NDU88_005246 [Pleurodeles waltl]|uniref:Uncharacterized protein n=1 Tax=Pleurodeles waltl TaxID=8319 RepID=A0AAV7VMN5_PLEWA|nr:hypothetical protein NDU88_005246 [Pleurodeles waltl]